MGVWGGARGHVTSRWGAACVWGRAVGRGMRGPGEVERGETRRGFKRVWHGFDLTLSALGSLLRVCCRDTTFIWNPFQALLLWPFVLFQRAHPRGRGSGGQCSLRALTLTWLLALPPQGNTGVLVGVFLVSFVALVALVTVLSGIGVGEHCDVGTGGVYSMIAAVLGGQTGGAIGLLYVLGQVRPLANGIAYLALLSATFFSSTFPSDLVTGKWAVAGSS